MKFQPGHILGRLATCLALLAGLLAAGFAARPVAALDPPKTIVDGNITANTTWLRANSPYLVTVPMSVAAAATLTIEPGVEVQFLKGAGMRIDGGLQARGTQAQQIVMHAAGDDWLGLQIVQPAGNVQLQSVTLADALSAISLGPGAAGPARRVDLIASLLQNNTVGINVDGAALGKLRLTMRSNLITGNQLGMYINGLPAGQPRIKLNHNSFVSNGIALKALNIAGKALKARQQWWGSPSGPQILPLDSLTCLNSVSPAPGTSAQEIICGLGAVDAEPFSKVPAGRMIVQPGAPAKLEAGIGPSTLSDEDISSTSVLTVSLPANTFAQPVDLLAAPRAPGGNPPGHPTLLEFEITAAANGQELHTFNEGKQITIEVQYNPADLNGADPSKLVLYYFDEQQGAWSFAGISSMPDPFHQRFVARLEHLTRMRITSTEIFSVYLPIAGN